MHHKKLLIALLILAIVAFVAAHAVYECHEGKGGLFCKVFHIATL